MSITRKGYTDDSLLKHPVFIQYPHMQDTRQKLIEAGIDTYSKLLDVISNEDADPDTRSLACWTIALVHETIDSRRITNPLISALKSPHGAVREAAAHSLGSLGTKRGLGSLIDLVCEKQECFTVRLQAIQGLITNKNPHYFSRLRAVLFDETDDIRSRSQVLEWLNYPSGFDPTNDYIKFLQHRLADLRFWAAYRLSQENGDVSEALTVLDTMAAFDHHVPETMSWHVDREALPSLESIYWKRLGLNSLQNPHEPMYLISPAPEYQTFEWQFCVWQDGETFKELPEPHITFRVEPNWLARKLREKWPTVKLNAREPRPQTYLVDWLIEINGEPLIGGLHRDQYAVIVTGNEEIIRVFTAWYQSIIAPEQYLFLYEWAGLAVELKSGISAAGVQAAQADREKHMNAIGERAINYPWVIKAE